MIYSWKSNEVDFNSASERRMHELDRKLKLIVDRVIESTPVHKGIETMARSYIKLGQKMVNGKVFNIVKKVAA